MMPLGNKSLKNLDISTSQLDASLSLCHSRISLKDGFHYNSFLDDLPNGYLLRKNALFDNLYHRTILFSHQTRHLEKILKTKTIHCGDGCLGHTIYVTPIYQQSSNLIRDNFFDLVLSHQQDKHQEIIIAITDQGKDLICGFNYLLAGVLLDNITQSLFTDNLPLLTKWQAATTECLTGYYFTTLLSQKSDTKRKVDALSTLAKEHQFFAFLYFELLTQIIMLTNINSHDDARPGEFNAHVYYGLLPTFLEISGDRFDASRFCPNHIDLERILLRMETVAPVKIFDLLIENFVNFITQLEQKGILEQNIRGQFARYMCNREQNAKIMKAFHTIVDQYRKDLDIPFVINAATFKPELGICSHTTPNFTINGKEVPLTII